MREWVGKQVARYEHAARRVQTFLWVIIAINTTIEVIWGILPIEIVLIIYMMGGCGLLTLGYVSHRARVGQAILKSQFDIENKEAWNDLMNYSNAKLEKYRRMSDGELDANIAYWGKRLKIDETEIEWEESGTDD